MRPFDAAAGEVAKRTIEGAYREQPGERPKSTPADELYTATYWRERQAGRSVDDAARIAWKAAFPNIECPLENTP